MSTKRPEWMDSSYLDKVLRVITTDEAALQRIGPNLTYDDFTPKGEIKSPHSRGRWIVGAVVVDHYKKYAQLLNGLLRTKSLEYIDSLSSNKTDTAKVEAYLKYLSTVPASGAEAVIDMFISYKESQLRGSVLQEMVELQASGQLTQELWHKLTQKAFGDVSAVTSAPTPTPWPEPLGGKALYGLAGDFVRLVEPQSEADPAALLLQFLTTFGSVVGRSPYYQHEENRHHTNLYMVLVGETSTSAKGTSWNHVRERFRQVDPDWASKRLLGGLSTGEGLVQMVRDPAEEYRPSKKQTMVVDPGELDKRTLAIEEEFSRVLKVCGREGNILSEILRQGWQSGDLNVITKGNALRATGAHISIIGHVTPEELRRKITETDQINGYANRFLWVCVRSSKKLPDGGHVNVKAAADLEERIQDAVEFGREVGRMRRTKEASVLWHAEYKRGIAEYTGVLGAVTARAAPQIVRLSILYALLDKCESIKRCHLEAALAAWKYCEDSARYIFGDALGDPVADKILAALRRSKDGLTRSQIYKSVFGSNLKSEEIDRALTTLQKYRLADMTSSRVPGQDKPTELWRARS
jgi:hypothetical protein